MLNRIRLPRRALHCAAILALLPAVGLSASARATSPAAAPAPASCTNTGDFATWRKAFVAEAAKAGISRRTLAKAEPFLTLDPAVLKRDRAQSVFQQPFDVFAGRMASTDRVQRAKQLMAKHKAIFDRTEKRFGVPAAVISAFWGLETDFGAFQGNFSSIRSLATLAYDCRRPDLFREELMSVLQIVERGDLQPDAMIGAWAGELGQTQFLPKFYVQYAIDEDGDGRSDLINSVPDLIASTGNYIAGLGWKRGEPWLEEVVAPQTLDWSKADLTVKLPRSAWAKMGLRRIGGGGLEADALPASLLLPMGRFGPAFLAYDNFGIYPKWNASLIYSTTAAHLAGRIAGAKRFSPVAKSAPKPLTMAEVKELQSYLTARGHYTGTPDGKLGAGTRAAVRAAQLEVGLPADAYPTPELLAKLRR